MDLSIDMELRIPTEYRRVLRSGKVFAGRYTKHSLLLLDQVAHGRLMKHLEGVIIESDGMQKQLGRMIKAGIIEIEVKKHGTVNLPSYFAEWLGGEVVDYKKGKLGVVVSRKKRAKLGGIWWIGCLLCLLYKGLG